jgi:hypothetical protein
MGLGGPRQTPTDLISRKTRYPFYRRLGWPRSRLDITKKFSQVGFDPWIVQPVTPFCTDYAIPPNCKLTNTLKLTSKRTNYFFL